MAGSLISVAEVTSPYESGIRNLENAWLALKAADDFADTLDLDEPEREHFRDRYAALCLRLANVHTQLED